jgi:hypothetical protein
MHLFQKKPSLCWGFVLESMLAAHSQALACSSELCSNCCLGWCIRCAKTIIDHVLNNRYDFGLHADSILDSMHCRDGVSEQTGGSEAVSTLA